MTRHAGCASPSHLCVRWIKEEETPEQVRKGEKVIGKQLWELKGWEVEGGASKMC